jgi:hypothetical protein
MKKSLIFAVLFAIGVAVTLPAQDYSAGAGVLYSAQFGGGLSSTSGGYVHYPVNGFGGFLFFDASYVEASAGVFFGTMKVESLLTVNAGSLISVNIGALGKYPIEMDGFVLYPLFGLEYDMSISAKNVLGAPIKDKDGKENASQFSAIWFKGGIGADYDIADSIYLRGQFLYGARLATQFENDLLADRAGTGVKTALGHGLNIKLALGYKF